MTKTQEDRFVRDISAIKKSLQSIAEDLRYFRKKDEAAVVEEEEEEEEPEYTCKDCTEYQWVCIGEPDTMAHWCALHCCTISSDGLREPCSDFVKDGEFS